MNPLVIKLMAPYAMIPERNRHGDVGVAWGLVYGRALHVAGMGTPPENPRPLEQGPDGAALRWLVGYLTGNLNADSEFQDYLSAAPKLLHDTALILRFMLRYDWSLKSAIAHLHPESCGDWPQVPAYIRERLLSCIPEDRRVEAANWIVELD